MAVTKLVLVRHGESQWNNENRFTGWYDVDLSDKGRTEAKAAGELLKAEGFTFDFAYTSVLKRAIHTLWNILDELDQAWLPTEKSWKLNERHYGASHSQGNPCLRWRTLRRESDGRGRPRHGADLDEYHRLPPDVRGQCIRRRQAAGSATPHAARARRTDWAASGSGF